MNLLYISFLFVLQNIISLEWWWWIYKPSHEKMGLGYVCPLKALTGLHFCPVLQEHLFYAPWIACWGSMSPSSITERLWSVSVNVQAYTCMSLCWWHNLRVWLVWTNVQHVFLSIQWFCIIIQSSFITALIFIFISFFLCLGLSAISRIFSYIKLHHISKSMWWKPSHFI